MDIYNILIIVIFLIIIFLIQKNKYDKTQNQTKTKNISVNSYNNFLKVLKKDCDSKCYICVGIVEMFKKLILKMGFKNALKYIDSNPSYFTSDTGEYIYIWKYIPKTDQFYFIYHPSKYTHNKTALEAQYQIDNHVCIDKSVQCNIRKNCEGMLELLKKSKNNKAFYYYDWYDPLMKIKIRKKAYIELIGENTVITCAFYHEKKYTKFDIRQFMFQMSGILIFIASLYFIDIDNIFKGDEIYKYFILIISFLIFVTNIYFSSMAIENTKSELEILDSVNSTAIKISAFGITLWVFQRAIQQYLNKEQSVKFVLPQILAITFGVLSLFTTRTSNEAFYIKAQTMVKTNFLIISLCYILIAVTYSLTLIKKLL